MDTHTDTRILLIGGSGQVATLGTKNYADKFSITSLIRREEKAEEVTNNGATPLVRDVTELSVQQWAEIFRDFDVVVWTAGNGGRGGAEVTYAVDRDAAIKAIDGLRQLQVEDNQAPKFIMVSYMGSLENETDDDGSWLAYVESKKAVDNYLLDTSLDYVILAPTRLTTEPAKGIAVTENSVDNADQDTSRELVAHVIFELAGRPELPSADFVAFHDGTDEVSSIPSGKA